MIIGVFWYGSTDKLYRDSNYRVVRDVIQMMPKDKYSFIVNYPIINDKEIRLDFEADNVLQYGVPILEGRMAGCFINDYGFLRRLERKVPLNCFWNNLVEVSDVVKNAFRNGLEELPLISQHHYTMHKSLGEMMFHKEILYRQVLGAILSEFNVFHSKYSMELLDESVRDSEIFNDLELSSMFIPHGVFGDLLLKKAKENKREGKIKLIYNHRLESYKNYTETFKKLDVLYKKRGDFEMYVTFGAEKPSFVEKYKWCKVVDLPSMEDYYNLLLSCDFGVLESKHETFCISAVEAMALGVRMYMPDGLTFREIVNNKSVLFNGDWMGQLDSDMDNVDKFRKQKVDSKYLERYSHKTISKKWEYLFQMARKKQNLFACKEGIQNYLKKVVKEGDFNNVYNLVRKDLGLGSQALPMWKFAGWLDAMGFDINIKNANIVINKM